MQCKRQEEEQFSLHSFNRMKKSCCPKVRAKEGRTVKSDHNKCLAKRGHKSKAPLWHNVCKPLEPQKTTEWVMCAVYVLWTHNYFLSLQHARRYYCIHRIQECLLRETQSRDLITEGYQTNAKVLIRSILQ